MELYIEKNFLDDFYLSVDTLPTIAQQVLISIFKEYGEVRKFIDIPIDSLEELTRLKLDNLYFAYLCEYSPPITVIDFKDHLLRSKKHEQTIVLTQSTKEWFGDAEQRGILCLSIETYEERISTILQKCQHRIDLSKSFPGWEVLQSLASLPINTIDVCDGYILKEKGNIKLKDNLFPMLEQLTKHGNHVFVKLFTKEFKTRIKTSDEIKMAAKITYGLLNSIFAAKPIKFQIYSSDKNTGYTFDFHDRVILSNFYLMECGKGFNLVPHEPSNSELRVETVFDKYVYNRHKNLKKEYTNLETYLKRVETLQFRMYPE